jgi:hypothetical protein
VTLGVALLSRNSSLFPIAHPLVAKPTLQCWCDLYFLGCQWDKEHMHGHFNTHLTEAPLCGQCQSAPCQMTRVEKAC